MPESNEQQAFFIDDDLIERLMRGDALPDRGGDKAKQRPAEVSSLAKVVTLAGEGKLDDAVRELEAAAKRGDNPLEVSLALGHLRFEQQNWVEAARCYASAAELDPKHRTAFYNLGLVLERQGEFDDASQAFTEALAIDAKRWQAHLGRGLSRLEDRCWRWWGRWCRG